MIKEETEQYLKLLDLVFDKPPKNVSDLAMKTLTKYKSKLVYYAEQGHIVAGVTVVEIGDEVFGIANMVVHPKRQGKGYGELLLLNIHLRFKGTFILKSRNAKGFYEKQGYKEIGDVMVYNNKGVDF